MRLLSTSEVLRVTEACITGMTCNVTHSHGLSNNDIKMWIDKGVITPISRGKGSGNYHQYTPMQCLAITYCASLWRCLWRLELLRPLFDHIAGMSEKELVQYIAEGNRVVVNLPSCGIVRIPLSAEMLHDAELIDLHYVHMEVMAKIAEIQSRPKRQRGTKRVVS